MELDMASSCEFDFMEYINEESINANLICPICHKPLREPVCTPCDHTYGHACISHWLSQHAMSSCPTCNNQPLLMNELTPATRLFRNMLDELQVRCKLCEQTGLQRGNFLDHINKICPNATVRCQAVDIKCPWKGIRSALDHHVAVCAFEPLRPVLAALIADNRQLSEQVRAHDHKINELDQRMSKLNDDDSSDESDDSTKPKVSVNNEHLNEENAVFIRNLPSTVKFNEVFDMFGQYGRIKYNPSAKRAAVFIFRNAQNKNSSCNGKVYYVDKASVTTAIAALNNKHIPQWNTRIFVCISDPKRKNVKNAEKGNEEHVSIRLLTPVIGDQETICSGVERKQSADQQHAAAPKNKNRTRRRKADKGDPSANED